MDPLQCLIDLDQAISDGRYSDAIMYLKSYYEWRIKGGYEPKNCLPISKNQGGDDIASWCAYRLSRRAVVGGPWHCQACGWNESAACPICGLEACRSL